MLAVSDLITELDLLAIDPRILETLGSPKRNVSDELAQKRRLAHAWIVRAVEASGRDPRLHTIRRLPDAVFASTAGSLTDVTSLLGTLGTVNSSPLLSALIATPATDALYVGCRWPMRGVAVGVFDQPNTAPSALTAAYWNGAWTAVTSLTDGTLVNSATFGKGGVVVWATPEDDSTRPFPASVPVDVNSLYFWLRLSVSSPVSGAAVLANLLPLRVTRYTLAAAYYALGHTYLANAVGTRPNYMAQAKEYLAVAQEHLTGALQNSEDEFDVGELGGTVTSPLPNSPVYDRTWLTTIERG